MTKYLIFVQHPETGSSTSLGGETKVDCLLAAINWLGGTFQIEQSE